MSNEPVVPVDPAITRLIISAIRQEYAPCKTVSEATDFLSTIDILENISGFCITDVETVTKAMIDAGYIIRTIEGSPYWLLIRI